MKLETTWGKIKSWFKTRQSAKRIETKRVSVETKKSTEIKTSAFKPVFHPGGLYYSDPFFNGTNENRKRKFNKLHKRRILRRKHRKVA